MYSTEVEPRNPPQVASARKLGESTGIARIHPTLTNNKQINRKIIFHHKELGIAGLSISLFILLGISAILFAYLI
jgi:hypothetical protein